MHTRLIQDFFSKKLGKKVRVDPDFDFSATFLSFERKGGPPQLFLQSSGPKVRLAVERAETLTCISHIHNDFKRDRMGWTYEQ